MVRQRGSTTGGGWGASARLAATVATVALLAACGTRLDDSEIRAGAGVGESAAGVEPAGVTEEGGLLPAPEAGSTADAVDPAAEPAGSPTPVVVAAPPVGRGSSSGPTPAVPGGAGTRAPSAAAGGNPATASAANAPSAAPAASPVPAAGEGTGAGAGSRGAAPVPAPDEAPRSPVVIGHIGDYSGIVGSVLGQGALAAQVAVRYTNDHGGLNGHPIKLVTGDSAADPARALSVAKEMVENNGVIAFMGNIWPLSGRGAQSYLEGKRIPVIGGDAAARFWNDSPVYFPHGAAWPTVTLAAAKMAVDLAKPKIAVLHCVEAEACHIWTEVLNARAAEVGAEVVYDAQVSLAQPDFTAECLQARNNGAQAILAGVESASISRLARNCSQQGYRPQYVTGSFAAVASTAEDPNLDGIVLPVSTFPFPADDSPATRLYHEAIARYAPKIEQGPTTSAVWSAGAVLRHVGQALPDSPTPQDFFAAVWRVSDETFGGLTPPVTFVEGKPTPETNCFFTMTARNGRFVAPKGSQHSCF